MKLCTLIIAFFIISVSVFAQQVVVSEYWNISATPEGEWTELLVVNDNVNMVGWILRDNSETDGWQGGIIFKDVSLWRNIRKGTIIVVNHRDYASNIDKNKSDGYIEVSAEDKSVFDTISYFTGAGYTWSTLALSISQKNDIIELLDNNNNHVHSLSHNAGAISDYLAITANKINRVNSSALVSARSVSVYPGTSIDKYNSGNTTSDAIVGSTETKGKPNKGLSGQDENQAFWREIRQPEWTSPTLTATIVTNAVQLSWSKCTDPVSADTITGYLVLKIPNAQLSSAGVPVDGISYSVGSQIGSAQVIASINGSDKNSYKDASNFPCGETFIYRVFAYKFSNDDQNQSASNPRNARGRSYNETSFAQKEVVKAGITNPTVSSENGVTSLCNGDNIKLTATDNGGNYQYQWYVDNSVISGATTKTYNTAVSGNYKISIFDSGTGCYAYSNELVITFIDYPNLKLSMNLPGQPSSEYKEVKSNQTVTICNGQSANVKVSGASSIQWYRNDAIYKSPVIEGKLFALYESGKYYAIAKNSNLCADTTFIINLNVITVNYTISPTNLTFNLTSNDTYGEQNITVTNNSDNDMTFENVTNSANFSIVSPNPPYTVLSHNSLVLTIRFNPSSSGQFNESILLYAPCKNSVADEIKLIGNKEQSTVTINKNQILFHYLVNCDAGVHIDSLVTIKNLGSDDVVINQPTVASPFEVLGNFPITLSQNGTANLTVRFNNTVLGDYTKDLIIPYSINSDTKNLLIHLIGSQVQPEYDYNYSEIIMQDFSDVTKSRDTFLIINNTGKTTVIFNEQPSTTEVRYKNLPLRIEASKSDTLKITVSPSSTKTFNLSLSGDSCKIPGDYSIVCNYISSEYYVSVDTIEFGKIIKCPNNITRDSSFYIKINGSPINPTITNISLPDGFIINKANGDALTDSTSIVVNFVANVIKQYSSELSFTIMPNNITKKILLRAELIEPKLIFPDTLLFSPVSLNTQASSTLQILNNTDLPVELISISSPNSPFGMQGITVPQIINVAGEFNTNFNITVSNYGKYYSDVTIHFRIQDCEFDSVITLKADVQNTSVQTASLDVRNINTELGNFILPFYIDLHGANYSDVVVNGLSFDMSYNPTVYLPISIIQEQRIDLSDAYIDDKGVGKVRVTMNTPAGANMTDGKLFTIRSKALWGNADYSGIKIENIKIYAKAKLNVEDDSATVKVINPCGYDNSIIGIDGTPVMKINVAESNIIIQYGIITDEQSQLEIYDMSGNKVFTKNITSKSGLYTETIENDFNSGTYFAKFTNGNIAKTLKFMIVK
jgi:hypothetical protein